MNALSRKFVSLVIVLTLPTVLAVLPVPRTPIAGTTALPAGAASMVDGQMDLELQAAPGRDGRQKRARQSGKRERKQGPARTESGGKRAKKAKVESAGGASSAACKELGLEPIPGTDLCTHGPDPAPSGLDVDQAVRPLPKAEIRQARARMATICDSDGTSGHRIQPLYVYAQGNASQYGQYRGSLQAWLAGADQILYDSAAMAGGSRRFRFVMTPDCQVDVQELSLSPAAVMNFGAMVSELQSLGFNRKDRIYLLFVDVTNAGICGLGTLVSDDRPGPENLNNAGPAYSRVDAGCWSDVVVSHELMHNLGGVQGSSPHSSGLGHCIDDYDVMCYQDGTSRSLQVVCGDSTFEFRFDCGNDDYFHPNPPPGSYLATHWNTANSPFLAGDGLVLSANTVAITNPQPGARHKGKRRLTVGAAADSGAGVGTVEFRACTGSSCSWETASPFGVDSEAPFTARRKLPKKGTVTFLVQMTDAVGNASVSDPVTIKVDKPKKKKR